MEISPELARACMENYVQVMKSDDPKPIEDSYSTVVSFSTPEFAEWLQQHRYLETSSQLKLAFGIYTLEAAISVGKPEYAGRLTTFVWPVVNGEEMAPFNGGQLSP